MRKNKLYFLLAILTSVFLLATAAICNQCQAQPEEETAEEEETAREKTEEAEEELADEVGEEEIAEEEATKEEAAEEEEEAEAEEESPEEAVAPTISLEIYEGPTPADDVCYYRIKATVAGNPTPTVEFSKDDSLGAFGSKKAQVNLHDPSDTYTLTATATNSEGTATDSIDISWGCEEGIEEEEEEEEEEETAFAVTSVTASVSPPSYTGVCPKEFTWSAIITVNAPGTVTYQWEVEGGSPDPPKNLTFSSAGSKTITKSCHLSCGWPNTTLWRQVRIISPNEMVSNQATETFTCYPDIDVRPHTVNFGEIACHSSASYGVVIENVSPGKLDINMVNITAGSSFFSIEDDPCTGDTLFRGQQCTISIKFGPLSVCSPSGTIYSGNLRIRTNDPDEEYVDVILITTQK